MTPSQTVTTKSKEKIIEEQIRKWQLARQKTAMKSVNQPVITISREVGSGGESLAKLIAETFSLDCFDREIIQGMAESIQMSEKIVSSLDEKMRSSFDNWIQILKTTRYLWPDKYRSHLTKVVCTIAEHGNAVIVGRGAHYLLPAEETLRLRFVAPLKFRIDTVATAEGVSQEEAAHMIIKGESDRKAYIEQHFHLKIDDPSYYDLVINTQYISPETTLEIIREAMKNKDFVSRSARVKTAPNITP